MTCKGIIFRGYRGAWKSGNQYEFRQGLRLLKRMSCEGCPNCGPLLDELREAMKADDVILPEIVDGACYSVRVIPHGERLGWSEYSEDYCDVEIYLIPEPEKTCKHGHHRTPENTNKDGSCRTCGLDKMRKRRATNKAAINEIQRKSYRKSCDELSNSYLNRLVTIKTGLRAHEITDEDREARKQSVLANRMKRAQKAGLTTSGVTGI